LVYFGYISGGWGMNYNDWREKNKLDDEYFHVNDMYWFAEQAM